MCSCTVPSQKLSTGSVDPAQFDRVCLLNKFLCGLKQAPQAWYNRFTTYITSLGFVEAKSNTSLFVFRRGTDTIYLLLYVDDIVLTVSSAALLQQTISTLKLEFAMTDLRSLHHFVGVSIQHQSSTLHCRRAPSFTVTMSALSTSPPTSFSTSAGSMSRSISTLYENVWPSVMYASFSCRWHPSSWISSRRVCLIQCFQSFGTASTFTVARVSTVGGVKNMFYYRYIGPVPPLM
jgi:hypothetical protein